MFCGRLRPTAALTVILPAVSPSTAKVHAIPPTSIFSTIPRPDLRAPPGPMQACSRPKVISSCRGVYAKASARPRSRGGDETMQLEWVTDAAFRFFSTQPDELFGYVLHPVDLATNKASAAADRRVPRDIVDLVTIHENILPLGAVLSAAVGKFPGVTPEEMLAEITRHSRFTIEEFQALATEQPIDVPGLHRRIRSMIEDAESFLARLPSDAVGVIFMEGERAVQPDVNILDQYQRNPGAPSGFWPTSPEISRAMLERYGKPKP